MVVGHVDQVGVAFPQVSQEGAEQGLVGRQRGQVQRAAALQVPLAWVSPRPQQRLHQPHLTAQHRQVQRRLQPIRGQDPPTGLGGGVTYLGQLVGKLSELVELFSYMSELPELVCK